VTKRAGDYQVTHPFIFFAWEVAMDDLLTARETAEFFRWTVQTVYAYSSRRILPSIKVGRSLRFRRADLEHLLTLRPTETERPADEPGLK